MAEVKSAILKMPQYHRMKKPQPPPMAQRVLLSPMAILNCVAIDTSLVRCCDTFFVKAALKKIDVTKKRLKR